MPPQYWLYGLAPLNHLYTLARISFWPPEDGSICDPKHVGVNFTLTFNVFLINIKLWVHELVIIETGHINARFNHEVWKKRNLLNQKWSHGIIKVNHMTIYALKWMSCTQDYFIHIINCMKMIHVVLEHIQFLLF
jgi:hypothetical protein